MALTTSDVWSAFSQRLQAVIRARVADPADADDILQDVFLKVHLRLDTLQDESRLAPWLFQITRNAITDYYRGRRPFVELPDEYAAVSAADEDEAARQLASGLHAMIGSLPPTYQEALRLAEIEGLSQKEVAEQLDLSYSGAKSHVCSAAAGCSARRWSTAATSSWTAAAGSSTTYRATGCARNAAHEPPRKFDLFSRTSAPGVCQQEPRSSTLPKKPGFISENHQRRAVAARLCMIAGRAPLFELRLLACRASQLRPGDPVAPAVYRLWLLPSGPDQIHSSTPHRTQPSTLFDKAVPAAVEPSE